jgi:hypothetical protein
LFPAWQKIGDIMEINFKPFGKASVSFIAFQSFKTVSGAGVDVMITIFWRFSYKPMLWIKVFAQFSFVLGQNANIFANLFWQKYIKNHNIGPRRYKNLQQNQRPGGNRCCY